MITLTSTWKDRVSRLTIIAGWLGSILIAQVSPGQPVLYLDVDQGLSNSTVTSILKDKYGFMWFATFDGLNRYDGYSFIKFRTRFEDSLSLPDNQVNVIADDEDGALWVGTRRGAAVMNAHTLSFSRIHFFDENRHELPGKQNVNTIFHHQGKIYLGTSELGLFECVPGSVNATLVKLDDNTLASDEVNVRGITAGDDGRLYMATTQHGVAVYDPADGRFRSLLRPLRNANCIRLIQHHTFLVGTNDGLYELDAASGKAVLFKMAGADLDRDRVMSITEDENGMMWITTDGGGLYRIDPVNRKALHIYRQEQYHSISSDHLYCVYIDDEQRKWIGTMRGGLNMIENRLNPFTVVRHQENNPQSLASNIVFSFCEDGDDIWVGTDGKGLSVWDRRKNIFRNFRLSGIGNFGLAADYVPTIVREKPGSILIGTYGAGVIRYIKKENKFERVRFNGAPEGQYVWSLYKAPDGTIWAGCLQGRTPRNNASARWLYRYDQECRCFIDAGFPVSDEVLTIADDQRGNIWIGTFSSAIRINKTSPQIQRIDLDATVRDIQFSKNGGVWIGTQGNGLLLYNPTNGTVKTFTEREGLPNNVIMGLEADGHGFIWGSTLSGLTRFTDSGSPSFRNFYAADGLQGDQFYFNASARLASGELMFGGLNGFTVVAPDSIETYRNFPSIQVTGMRVMNADVGISNEFVQRSAGPYDLKAIVLPYDKAMFSIDVVAPEYSFASKIRYSYFLKGWDKDWNYLQGSRTISYSRLVEGTYQLEIRTTNPSGEWNASVKSIKIVILPPWYRSGWAYLVYALLILLSVYGYLAYQRKKARMEYEVEIANIKASQEAELNERKISFFTNIAHELRTPLTLIVNPIKDLLNNDGRNVNLVDIGAVHRNASRLLSLVDQLLLFKSADNEVSALRLETVDLNEVCNEVFLCFINQVKNKGIDYRFESDQSRILALTDREKVEIVLFNLVSNAIKYTPANGRVSVSLTATDNAVEITVKDSGPGIPLPVGEKLFNKFYRVDNASAPKKNGFGIGLYISRRIAVMQKGDLTYSNLSGGGTVFNYRFPKGTVVDEPAASNSQEGDLLKELIFEQRDESRIITETAPSGELIENLLYNKETVLVIDDDIELRAYIRQILDGYSLLEAGTAEEGLDVIKDAQPDIIISDIVMPGMSGVELCARIKDSADLSHIPIILLTGTSSSEVKLKGIECGADDYITKPFEKELLLARIRSILKGRDSLRKYFFNEVTLQNNTVKVSEEYRVFLQECIGAVEANVLDPQFNVTRFAKLMGMSHSSLYRKVKSMSGLSISEFMRYLRLKRAAELLITTDSRVKEVAYAIGFENVQYFREQFTRLFKVTPSEYIKRFRRPLSGMVPGKS